MWATGGSSGGSGGSDRRGFALIAVLWVLVLASVLAVELHGAVRADQRVAANARAAARARWAARGGLAQATEALRRKLATPDPTGTGFAAGTAMLVPALDYTVDGVEVRVRVVDARARVNLNLATADELRALFVSCGVDVRQAAVLADVAARWRAAHAPTPVTVPLDSAAADSAAREVRPPRGAFADVEELLAVPGFTPEAYARVAPFLTVVSDGKINLNTAPLEVLRTLPGLDAMSAEAVASRRTRAAFLSAFEVPDALPRFAQPRLQEALEPFMERVVFSPRHGEVTVTAEPQGSPLRARLSAVAAMTGGARFYVLGVAER